MPTIQLDALKETANKNVFGIETPAFYDTFSGLVPCRVIGIKPGRHYGFLAGHNDTITAIVTKDRGPYKKGETIVNGASHIIPRRFIRIRDYHYRILSNYVYAD